MPDRTWVPECYRCGEPIRLKEALSWLYDLASGSTHPYHPDCARAEEGDQLIRRLEATVARLRQVGVVVSYTVQRK